MLAPLTKFAPLIVNGCGLLDPVTGFGLTLLIVGAAFGAAITVKVLVAVAPPPEKVTLQL